MTLGSPRMTAVPQVEKPKHSDLIGCCADNVRLFGSLGYCKKHSPFLTPQHMGWSRYLTNVVLISGRIIVASVLPKIITVGVLIALTLIFLQAVGIGIEKQGLVACQKYQTYSQTYTDFYVTAKQKSMCDSLGVTVDAPVR